MNGIIYEFWDIKLRFMEYYVYNLLTVLWTIGRQNSPFGGLPFHKTNSNFTIISNKGV